MSIKVKYAIIDCLDKIAAEEIDETIIRTLLVSSREYLKNEGLIKELAHFVAHPTRNKGLFHKSVNSRYAKLKQVYNQVKRIELLELSKREISEDELSDFLLDGVDIDRVPAKLFESLYHDGLEDLPEEHLLKYTGFTKAEAKEAFSTNYVKSNGYYVLKVLQTEKLIFALENLPEDPDTANAIEEAKRIAHVIRGQINTLQRVIRGAIYYSSVFSTDMLREDFHSSMLQVFQRFDISTHYLHLTANKMEDVLVCIMALLHDSTFRFYDGNQGKVFLCLYDDFKKMEIGTDSENSLRLFENGVLALYLKYEQGQATHYQPLYISELPIRQYVSKREFLERHVSQAMNPIPWICARQSGGKLKLEEYQ